MTQAAIARLGGRASTRERIHTWGTQLILAGCILLALVAGLVVFAAGYAAGIDAQALAGLGR